MRGAVKQPHLGSAAAELVIFPKLLVLSLWWWVWGWESNTEETFKRWTHSFPNMFKSLLPSLAASRFVRHMWDIDLPAAWCCAQADSWSVWSLHTETHRDTHTQRHRGETGEREGVRDISTGLEIEQDWPRSEPACLATCLAYEFSKEVMSRYPQCGWYGQWHAS